MGCWFNSNFSFGKIAQLVERLLEKTLCEYFPEKIIEIGQCDIGFLLFDPKSNPENTLCDYFPN